MTDDPSKTKLDRKLVAAEEAYEVAYFAQKHGLPMETAKVIIEQNGPSREACDRVAERTKSGNR